MQITPRPVIDITARNLARVPASRGGNPISFIVIHYLGVDGQNPDLYCVNGECGYGGHYNIFWNGDTYMAADPKTAVVWQCGGGRQGYDPGSASFFGICTNFNSIGIECSVHYDGTWYFTEETQEALVYLVSTLMDKYGISMDHVIRHWDVTGKHCPAPYVENTGYKTNWTWDQFKQILKDYRSKGDEDEVIKEIFEKVKVKEIYKGLPVRTVVNLKDGDKLNVRLAPRSDAPVNPAWKTLGAGNKVRESCRFTNNWAGIIIDHGEKSTVGYVNAKYLK